MNTQLPKLLSGSGVGKVAGDWRNHIVRGQFTGKMLGFRAVFCQTGIVRVFAKKAFVHMRSCRDEFLVFRALLSGDFFHDLISWILVKFARLLSPTFGTTERDSLL